MEFEQRETDDHQEEQDVEEEEASLNQFHRGNSNEGDLPRRLHYLQHHDFKGVRDV